MQFPITKTAPPFSLSSERRFLDINKRYAAVPDTFYSHFFFLKKRRLKATITTLTAITAG